MTSISPAHVGHNPDTPTLSTPCGGSEEQISGDGDPAITDVHIPSIRDGHLMTRIMVVYRITHDRLEDQRDV